jgi:hypothetical protein
MTPRPRKPGSGPIARLIEDWIGHLIEKLRPPQKKREAVYDWNGTCKYFGKKKD